MKNNKIELEKVAVDSSNYPPDNLPEFALVGRSNVGKSSFVNAMIGRKNYAKTSSTPGKTRTINFYNIYDYIRLVDLPGYGYAQVSKSERNSWKKIIESYLIDRENLFEVIQLIDIRHEPTQLDLNMHNWIIESGFSGIIIATKLDKIKPRQLNEHIEKIAKKLDCDPNQIIEFSSKDRKNVDEVWEILKDIVNFHS